MLKQSINQPLLCYVTRSLDLPEHTLCCILTVTCTPVRS